MANGKHPLRLKAEIKTEEEEKREDGKKKAREEQGKLFQFPRYKQNEHRSGEVSVSVRFFWAQSLASEQCEDQAAKMHHVGLLS